VPSQNPRFGDYIEKQQVKALIQTSKQALIGTIHVHPRLRIKDNFNRDEEPFIAITNASIVGQGKVFPFILLRKDEIIWLVPLEEDQEPPEDQE
jgi:hypothetical protein